MALTSVGAAHQLMRQQSKRSSLRSILAMASTWLGLLVLSSPFAFSQQIASFETFELKPEGGTWQVRAEGSEEWRETEIPTTNEAALADPETPLLGSSFAGATFLGDDFKGVAEYRVVIDPNQYEQYRDIITSPSDPPSVPSHESSWWIYFPAVATHTQVSVENADGSLELLGEHLGGWTPFDFDLTPWMKKGDAFALRVRVDELEGHNTQGFLPIIEPHFGGIWQAPLLQLRPPVHFNPHSTRVTAIGSTSKPTFHISAELIGEIDPLQTRVIAALADEFEGLDPKETLLAPTELHWNADTRTWSGDLAVDPNKIWSPQSPLRHQIVVHVQVQRDSNWETLHHWSSVVGWRRVETLGRQLLLNDQPIAVRGVLNWGYTRHTLGPLTDIEQFAREVELAKASGFNLMKFCLWVPPSEFLEYCDRQGMLVWMEYPTWHPKMDASTRDALLREYGEFFHHDGQHCSVILRSLTCETGHGADIEVLKALYDLGKERIPGAIIEDDSSWISWHRIHDFYDDHPYGNSHTWRDAIDYLDQHIEERSPMPLMLGEAIAADTWFDPLDPSIDRSPDLEQALLEVPNNDGDPAELTDLPFFMPGFSRANIAYKAWVAKTMGEEAAENLEADSIHYALSMRKFQIETFRAMQPDAGYVVSVIRDFPLAGMGLIDYADQPKHSPRDWQWQGETMLSLETEDDTRGYILGQDVEGVIVVTHHGLEPLVGCQLIVELDAYADTQLSVPNLATGEQARVRFQLPSPDYEVYPLRLRVILVPPVDSGNYVPTPEGDEPFIPQSDDDRGTGLDPLAEEEMSGEDDDDDEEEKEEKEKEEEEEEGGERENEGGFFSQLFGLGQDDEADQELEVESEDSMTEDDLPSDTIAVNSWTLWPAAGPEHFETVVEVVRHPSWDLQLPPWIVAESWENFLASPKAEQLERIVLARSIDEPLLERLSLGQSVVFIPNGQAGSFARENHWFLRGGLVIGQGMELLGPREFWTEIQTMDLADTVSPAWTDLDAIDPWLCLWNNHDIKEVKTHPLLFRMPVGEGSLWVNYLAVDSANATSMDVFTKWILVAQENRDSSSNEQGSSNLDRLRSELGQREVRLDDRPWQFAVDAQHAGVANGWHTAEFDASDWSPIRIDAHWDGQGQPTLDGWAWYRTQVTVPADWNGDELYLSFTGVDDHYKAYINGELVGSGGIIETRQTAFEERASHNISKWAKPGTTLNVAIEVYDWYGAGGIFRPVLLTARPIRAERPWLVK